MPKKSPFASYECRLQLRDCGTHRVMLACHAPPRCFAESRTYKRRVFLGLRLFNKSIYEFLGYMLYTIPPIIRFITVHFSLSLFFYSFVCTILFLIVYYSIVFTPCPYSVYCVFCVFCVFFDQAFGCYTAINVCKYQPVFYSFTADPVKALHFAILF